MYVAFAGGTNIVNMQYDGYLETVLTYYFPGSPIKFRNIGWEGDNVYEQFRDIGFGDWKQKSRQYQSQMLYLFSLAKWKHWME